MSRRATEADGMPPVEVSAAAPVATDSHITQGEITQGEVAQDRVNRGSTTPDGITEDSAMQRRPAPPGESAQPAHPAPPRPLADDDTSGLPKVWSGAALGDTAPQVVVRRRASDEWVRSYRIAVVVLDLVLACAAAVAAVLMRFGRVDTIGPVPYGALVAAFPIGWVVVQMLLRSYESRYLGLGPDEFKRVVEGGVTMTAIVCFAAYVAKIEVSRMAVGVALPAATLLTLIGRFGARKVLHHARAQGRAGHRMLVVGNLNDVVELITAVRREPHAGLVPVGVCLTRRSGRLDVPGPPIPVLGGLGDVLSAVNRLDADIVAVCSSRGVSADGLRRLAWELEGSGVDLVVAPALTNIAGPRVHVRPVAGLPLLHVEEPVFRGVGQIAKSTFDRVASLLLLVLLSPLLLGAAALIKLTSPGPVFFRQERIGYKGKPFRVWKFRTMYPDAEARLAELLENNETDGLLFKIQDDPRITPIGKWLRRFSIDELPQLFNVLVGEMSLVGPRPLPTKAEDYEGDVRRRLLVRPGITGLWQVSGRSDLPWEDAVRLDLYYVDNWSLIFDFEILWRTVFAVFRASGAY